LAREFLRSGTRRDGGHLDGTTSDAVRGMVVRARIAPQASPARPRSARTGSPAATCDIAVQRHLEDHWRRHCSARPVEFSQSIFGGIGSARDHALLEKVGTYELRGARAVPCHLFTNRACVDRLRLRSGRTAGEPAGCHHK
jgi:hypothetical protein